MDDLHPYDGRERRFRDGDTSAELSVLGRERVTRTLQLTRPLEPGAARYDLSYYSGGIGVLDRLFIRLACTTEEATAIIARLQFLDATEALRDPEWWSELVWLVNGEEDATLEQLEPSIIAFINDEKASFQPEAPASARVCFDPGSGVNCWAALYYAAGALNYLAFDQG